MKKNYISALVTVIIWATGASLLKSMFADLPSLEVLCISSIFSFIFLLLSNMVKGNVSLMRTYFPSEIIKLAALGLIGLFAYNALYYKGISILTSQEACILNYLWPVMLVIFSGIILKEKITFVKIIAILCSFSGVVVLSLRADTGHASSRLLGAICCLGAAACYALFCVINKKLDLDQNITMMVAWGTVAIGAGILGPMTETWHAVQGTAWIGILWMGLVVNAISYLSWAIALNNTEDSSLIANLAYLTPFFSIILSAIFLGETITWNAIVALVLIIAGVLISQLGKK